MEQRDSQSLRVQSDGHCYWFVKDPFALVSDLKFAMHALQCGTRVIGSGRALAEFPEQRMTRLQPREVSVRKK
jgi:hypothetical protein